MVGNKDSQASLCDLGLKTTDGWKLIEDDPTFSLEVENAYYVFPGAR